MATISQRLAAWSAALRWEDVPAEQRALVGLRVLDTIGLIHAGGATRAAAAAYAVALEQGGVAEAALAGRRAKVPAALAALAHGTVAHCRDFDDTFLDSVVHPGSTVIAAALAVGEAVDASDQAIATAIVAGYEAAGRIGAVAGRRFHAQGFHATGIVGALTAALTAAKLYGLDAEATAHALGLAGSMSSGLMAFIVDGGWSKWLHVGWSAHGGIVAAQLARRGFVGPAHVFEGRTGLYAAFTGEAGLDAQAVARDLGADWRGGAAHFKYYPCAHVIQPYIDAALAIRAGESIAPGEIAEVACDIAPWAVPIVCEPRAPKLAVASELEAIASLPYQVAASLADGKVDLDTIEAASRGRADLRDLAARVVHRADPALGRGFDGAIELRRRDGRIARRPVTSAPPDRGKLLAKFRANAGRALSAAAAEAAIAAALGGPLPDFRALRRCFAHGS